MNVKSSSSKITALHVSRKQAPSSPYIEFTKELANTANNPIRLIINCERFESAQNKPGHIVESIGNELRLWSQLLGARHLHSLYIMHPYRFLEPFELTKVLHIIACKFHVESHSKKRHTIVSGTQEISSEHLALVKGLGFNGYQIMLPSDQLNELSTLKKKINLLRDYSVSSVGVQLLHPDCLGEIRDSVRQIKQECAPDYICLGKAWDSSDMVSVQDTSFSEDSAHNTLDTLELGPEANSVINDIQVQNYCSPEKYATALEVDRLPIHVHHKSD